MTISEQIGFIGLGNMGVPMAGRLIDGGYSLIVNDIRPDAARPLLARGATWAASPAEIAAAAHTVITILPTSREVREVLLGTKGLLDALRPGSLVLEMTSADPSVTRELARAVLARMGKNIFHAGPVGAGHAIKLVNNMCSGGILALTIEAVAVAARAGVDPARAVEIIQASSGRSNASDYKFPQFILNGAFDAGFAIRLMLKDVDGYARLAQEGGVPSMMGRVASEVYRMAVARGMAELDHTAVARLIEEWAG